MIGMASRVSEGRIGPFIRSIFFFIIVKPPRNVMPINVFPKNIGEIALTSKSMIT